MTLHRFEALTTTPAELDIVATAIGDNTNQARSGIDTGKAVKLGADQNYVLCAADDEIEGFIHTVRGDTVNEGYSFGGVQRGKRIWAKVGDNQGATAMASGDYVVADAQVAFGTDGVAKVKTGNPTKHLWRCLRVEGAGEAGDNVLLERQ